ncbi:MAG: hypothetical protein HOJ59_02485 [Nitrosomonadales bacterium]|nr:hypothetical protein [Nitrosomonadales bacterium]
MNKHITNLIVIDAIARTSSFLTVAILSVYILHLDGNLTHYGDLIAIFGVCYGLAAIICSKYLLEYASKLLPFSYLLLILYSLLLIISSKDIGPTYDFTPGDLETAPLVKDIMILYVAIFINGVAFSIRSVMFLSELQKFTKDNRHLNLVISKYKLIGAILGSLATLGGSYFAHYYGFDFLFYTMFILYSLSFILSSFNSYVLRQHRRKNS